MALIPVLSCRPWHWVLTKLFAIPQPGPTLSTFPPLLTLFLPPRIFCLLIFTHRLLSNFKDDLNEPFPDLAQT